MNIAQLSEQLKDVPQNRLVDYARNPNSVVPQFLALAEIQRRQHLQNTPQPPAATVAEDVLAQAAPQQMPQQMAPQMAPQQMAQQLPENQPGVAQLPSGMPQGMASGGIVAFAGGGNADSYDAEDDDDIEDQRNQNQMMSLIAGLRTRARDSVAAVPRAIEAVPRAVESAASGLRSFASNIPKSYEQAKAVASSAKESLENDVEGFLSKIQRLESGGRHYDAQGKILTSPKGAEGIMQVMRKTQKDPGFGVTPARDRSPEELERVGKEYGIAMLKEFGDPKLAAMAYNWGPGNVKKWLESGQKTPIPAETRKYASHFAQGGIASFDGRKGSSVEEDEDYDNEYLNRSRSMVSGVRSLYDTLTTPKNYDLYDMYKRNIGDPFSKYANKVVDSFNETPAEQAQRFRNLSMNPAVEPRVGYREPLGARVDPPKVPPVSSSSGITSDDVMRLANVNAVNHAQKKEGLFKPSAQIAANTTVPSEQDFRNFDQAAALFQAEQQVKNLENPPEQAGPKEVDPYTARLLRIDQEREDIKSSAQTDKYLAMLQASLGMMAGTSPYAMANIGQGGMQGVAAYAAAKKQRAAELSDLGKYESRILNAKEMSEIKKAQLDVKRAELTSIDENRREKIAIAQERLANMPTRDQKLITQAMTLINADDRIPMLLKQQKDSGAAVGSPEYELFNRRINAIRDSYFKQAGVTQPVIEAVNIMDSAVTTPKKEGNWFTNLFSSSKPSASSNMPAPPPGFKVQ